MWEKVKSILKHRKHGFGVTSVFYGSTWKWLYKTNTCGIQYTHSIKSFKHLETYARKKIVCKIQGKQIKFFFLTNIYLLFRAINCCNWLYFQSDGLLQKNNNNNGLRAKTKKHKNNANKWRGICFSICLFVIVCLHVQIKFTFFPFKPLTDFIHIRFSMANFPKEDEIWCAWITIC